jgi:ABC-2 type transport system ATP-binding protein
VKEVIRVHEVSKSINNKLILNNVSLTIYSGETLGILGPNGAGKTTLLRIILGLYKPSAGSVSIHGNLLNSLGNEVRRKIGVVLDINGLYPRLTAYSNLEFYARIYRINIIEDKIDQMLEYVGLKDRKHSRVSEFSLGMSRRLAIARAIIHDPDIVILDEPTNGLDPEGTLLVRNLLINLKEMGKTVIINSHNLSEVEKVCDRVAILNKGALALVDTVENVIHGNRYLIIGIQEKNLSDKLIAKLSSSQHIESIKKTETGLRINLKSPEYKNEVLTLLKETGISYNILSVNNDSLETVFFELTKEGVKYE